MCNNPKKDFLITIALANTVIAAFSRATVYTKDATEEQRSELREALKTELRALGNRYRTSTPSDDEHMDNLRHLADQISRSFGDVLAGRRLRLGVAQKALNLYLKFLWCMGEITEPPHCPFDRTVLEAAPPLDRARPHQPWTRMDEEDEYRRWLAAARAAAGKEPLPEWELGVWAAISQPHR